MKFKNQLSAIMAPVALLIAGCAALDRDRENTLSVAGFHTVIATTAQQHQQLMSLPPGQVTPLRHGNQTVFIFPDRERNLLFVGREPNYQQYRRLRLQQQVARENLAAAQMWNDPGWGAWGPWDGYWW